MTSAIKELIIQDTDLPLLTPTIINQQFIEKSGNQIPFSKLIQLNVALDALQPTPPNANTVWFDNTILLQDASGGGLPSNTLTDTDITITDNISNSTTLNDNSLTFDDGSYTPSIGISSSDLVIDGQGARILLNANNNEFYIGEYSVGSAPVIISTGSSMGLIVNSRSGITNIGDCDGAFNQTKISVDDASSQININTGPGEFSVGDLNSAGNNTKIVINDPTPYILLQTSGAIQIDSGAGLTTIGDINGVGNGNTIQINDTANTIDLTTTGSVKIGDIAVSGSGTLINLDGGVNETITLTANNGLILSKSSIQYTSTYNTTSQSLNSSTNYAQTFNGSSLTATLPSVNSTNVGVQYLITNTNAFSLSVVSTGGQLIYSSTGTASATTRTLPVGHSHIFTAIRTTGASTFGWSMA